MYQAVPDHFLEATHQVGAEKWSGAALGRRAWPRPWPGPGLWNSDREVLVASHCLTKYLSARCLGTFLFSYVFMFRDLAHFLGWDGGGGGAVLEAIFGRVLIFFVVGFNFFFAK